MLGSGVEGFVVVGLLAIRSAPALVLFSLRASVSDAAEYALSRHCSPPCRSFSVGRLERPGASAGPGRIILQREASGSAVAGGRLLAYGRWAAAPGPSRRPSRARRDRRPS